MATRRWAAWVWAPTASAAAAGCPCRRPGRPRRLSTDQLTVRRSYLLRPLNTFGGTAVTRGSGLPQQRCRQIRADFDRLDQRSDDGIGGYTTALVRSGSNAILDVLPVSPPERASSRANLARRSRWCVRARTHFDGFRPVPLSWGRGRSPCEAG